MYHENLLNPVFQAAILLDLCAGEALTVLVALELRVAHGLAGRRDDVRQLQYGVPVILEVFRTRLRHLEHAQEKVEGRPVRDLPGTMTGNVSISQVR